MGYKEKLITHKWVFVRKYLLDHSNTNYPKYYKWINQFKCKECECLAFSSDKDDKKKKLDENHHSLPTKFDVFRNSSVLTCKDAKNNELVMDVIV